jgi:hypothetical protein
MDPFSEPPRTPVSVVVPETPRKRRIVRIVALASVALLAVAGVVFAVTRDGDAATYSLTAADGATKDVRSMTFITTTEGFGSEISAEVETDVENELVHITVDLGSEVFGLGGEIEMIVDVAHEVTYTNGSFFESLGLPLDTEWLSMDAEWFAENGDGTLFNAEAVANPLDAALVLDKAIKTEEVGFDEVGGVKVKHYRVTFRGEDVFAANGQLEAQLEEVDGELPDEIVYDFYIDEQNLIRRVSYQADIGPGEVTTDIVVTSINEPVKVKIPDDDDVTDARDLL